MKSLLLHCVIGVLLLAAVLFVPTQSQTQDAAKRRLVDRVTASYPVLARNLGLEGVVKVEAVVAADGSVKAVNIRGGHPVLAQAAINAVRRWRWEPAAHESHEVVEIRFSPLE